MDPGGDGPQRHAGFTALASVGTDPSQRVSIEVKGQKLSTDDVFNLFNEGYAAQWDTQLDNI
jgi:hypothetical protein